MKTIQEQIKELEAKYEKLDRSRMGHGYNPKRNEAIWREMREVSQIKGELLLKLEEKKEVDVNE